MPFVDETLPLSLQLFDFDATKFTRVVLKNNSGTSLVGSPFNLVHIGNGKYTNDTVVMPAGVDYIEATYETFSSAANRTAGTPLDAQYTAATDVFRLEVPATLLLNILNQLLNKLTNLSGVAVEFETKEEIESIIADAELMHALIEHKDIKTVIENNKDLLANIDNNELDATIDCKE